MTLRDATALAAFARCEQEGEYRYNLHYTSSRDEDAPHFGSILHVGRNEYFLREDVDAAVAAMRDTWGEYMPSEKEHRTFALAEAMMRGYAQHVGPPSKRGFKVLMGEQVVTDSDDGYGGVLDALIEVNGELAIDDLKTTGLNPSEAFSRQYEFNSQLGGYFDLGERVAGKPIAHAWVEVWHVPRGQVKDTHFRRYGPIYYSESVRAELRELRHLSIARATEMERGTVSPRMNPGACFRYNKLCTFFDACKADVDVRAGVIQSMLASGMWVERTWNFTKRGNE